MIRHDIVESCNAALPTDHHYHRTTLNYILKYLNVYTLLF